MNNNCSIFSRFYYFVQIDDSASFYRHKKRPINPLYIVYLDEIVEARKDTTVVIHPLTDHRRYILVEKLGKIFYAPDDFMLVMSYNPGYQSVLKELKQSTRQRFVSIALGWPGEDLETEIVQTRDALYSIITEPLTHDSDLKRSIEEILKNYPWRDLELNSRSYARCG